MNRKLFSVYSLTLLSMLIWGVSYSWVDDLLEYYRPETIASIRIFIAGPFLLSIALIFKKLQKVARRDLFILAAFALFDPFAYFLCESFGILHSSPVVASVIIATIPLLVPISAFFFLKERISVLNIIGLIVSFAGVLFVIINGELQLAIEPLGLILLSGAVVCAIFYNFFLKDLVTRYNVYTIITIQNLFAALYFLPVFLNGSISDIENTGFNIEVVTTILALSFFASAIAFIFYANAIKHIGITRTNVFANMIPVFAAIFAFTLDKEEIGLRKIFGILLVVAGLFLAQIIGKKKNES